MIGNGSLIGVVAVIPLALSLPKCGPTNEFVEPPPPRVTVALPEIKPLTLLHSENKSSFQ